MQLSLHKFFNACHYTSHAAVDHQVGGIVDVPLAQTGEGIAECELLKWFVQEVSQNWLILFVPHDVIWLQIVFRSYVSKSHVPCAVVLRGFIFIWLNKQIFICRTRKNISKYICELIFTFDLSSLAYPYVLKLRHNILLNIHLREVYPISDHFLETINLLDCAVWHNDIFKVHLTKICFVRIHHVQIAFSCSGLTLGTTLSIARCNKNGNRLLCTCLFSFKIHQNERNIMQEFFIFPVYPF